MVAKHIIVNNIIPYNNLRFEFVGITSSIKYCSQGTKYTETA